MDRFRKISACLLSMLVLLGTTSFTINMHFCMDQIESIAFLKDNKTCDMISQVPPCNMTDHQQKEDQEEDKDCCEDRTYLFEGQEEYKGTVSVSLPHLQFVAVIYAVAFNLLPSPVVDNFSFKEYSPPLIDRDIPVLVQSFLI